MAKLYILCGLPGSGKSYVADDLQRKTGAVLISTDRIRLQLFGDESSQEDNCKVFGTAYRRIYSAGRKGRDVIFDATNLTRNTRLELIQKFRGMDAVIVYCDTPYEVCCERNHCRQRVVPDSVMERMHVNWEPPTEAEAKVIVIKYKKV